MHNTELTKEIAKRQDYFKGMKKFFGFYNTLPDPDPILSKTGKAFEIYRELTSDAHLYANIQQRKAGIIAMERDFVVTNSSAAGRIITDYLQSEIDIDDIISQILNAPLFGFTVLEAVWKQAVISDHTLLLPAKLEEKPQEWFTFSLNNELMYKGEGGNPIKLPPHKFFLIQNNATYLNPYGEKALSRCYYPVTFKRNGMDYWVTFTEKYGLPFIIGKQPRTATDEQAEELANILRDMPLNNAAVIPDDNSIEIISFPSGASIDAYRTFLEFMNSEISKAVLTQTLTTEILSHGSYAATKTHKEMLSLVMQNDMKLVEKGINKIIKSLSQLNGYNKPLAEFKFSRATC